MEMDAPTDQLLRFLLEISLELKQRLRWNSQQQQLLNTMATTVTKGNIPDVIGGSQLETIK